MFSKYILYSSSVILSGVILSIKSFLIQNASVFLIFLVCSKFIESLKYNSVNTAYNRFGLDIKNFRKASDYLDFEYVKKYADKVVLLDKKILKVGSAEEVLNNLQKLGVTTPVPAHNYRLTFNSRAKTRFGQIKQIRSDYYEIELNSIHKSTKTLQFQKHLMGCTIQN